MYATKLDSRVTHSFTNTFIFMLPFRFLPGSRSFWAGAFLIAAGEVVLGAPYEHVLFLTIDGLHAADIEDPALAADIQNIASLRKIGITFTKAFMPVPTDSFCGLLSHFTGANPRTTGIYYDHAYSRTLYPHGSTPAAFPGSSLDSNGEIDWDNALLGGGDATRATSGAAGAASINPAKLQMRKLDGKMMPVFPHELLNVNTIFEVAHAAGLRTAYIDKHPACEIVNGPSGAGVDDFYAPESDAKVKMEGTGGEARLVDAMTATTGPKGLGKISKSIPLSNAYDDVRLAALLHQIDGKTSIGADVPGDAVPALFGMNFVALGNAQRLPDGGIDAERGPSAALRLALSHIDASVGRVVSELRSRGLFDKTLIVLTAKHGNSPRVGAARVLPPGTFTIALANARIQVAAVEQDDSVLLWLKDPTQARIAKEALVTAPGVDTVLAGGAELAAAGFGDPAKDDRTPDIIIKLKAGYLVSDSPKRAEHGGFSDDDTHVALVLASGALPPALGGSVQGETVSTNQIAVTALQALGLDVGKLQGAVAEKTPALPGTGIIVK